MNDSKIDWANISTITMVGELNDFLRTTHSNGIKLAKEKEAHILRDIQLEDGFFLEVLFVDEKSMHEWEKSIGVKKKE